jgi:hypothetical protein
MNRQNIDFFAESYPKHQERTPITELSINENNTLVNPHNLSFSAEPSIKKKNISSSKKLLTTIIIVIIGLFIYSSMAYTFTDNIFDNFNLELFSPNGSPGIIIVLIHSIIFLIITYFILKAMID